MFSLGSPDNRKIIFVFLSKKGDKKIGDSNSFFIDKKGVGNICTQGTWHTRQKAGAH